MFASINTSSSCSNVWEKKAAAFKVNGSVAINSFLRRLILSRLNPFLLLTKDIVYPIYNAILFSWELNLYHFSSVGDSWAKSVICRCSKGYLNNLCWQLSMVLSGQIHLWPSPKSVRSGGLFSCYDPGAHVTGRKEGRKELLYWLLPICVKVSFAANILSLKGLFPSRPLRWAHCAGSCLTLTLLLSCFHLVHHIKKPPRAPGTLQQCWLYLLIMMYLFLYISIDYLISYFPPL